MWTEFVIFLLEDLVCQDVNKNQFWMCVQRNDGDKCDLDGSHDLISFTTILSHVYM